MSHPRQGYGGGAKLGDSMASGQAQEQAALFDAVVASITALAEDAGITPLELMHQLEASIARHAGAHDGQRVHATTEAATRETR